LEHFLTPLKNMSGDLKNIFICKTGKTDAVDNFGVWKRGANFFVDLCSLIMTDK